MRIGAAKPLVALLAGLALSCGGREPGLLVLESVHVVDVERASVDSFMLVVVRNGIIEMVGTTATVTIPAGAETIDGNGLYLLPGLWDMHTHVEESDLEDFVSWGVLGIRDMGGNLSELREWQRRIALDSMVGPRIVASGPVLAGPPAQPDDDRVVVRNAREAARAVDSLAQAGSAFIKVHDGITPAMLAAITRAARARRLAVTGHVPAGMDPVAAARSGLVVIEHLEFVPDACAALFEPSPVDGEFRQPVPAGCDTEHLDSLLAGLARADAWLDPTISMFRIWVPLPHYQVIHAGFAELTPLIRRHRIRLLAGTDLGDDRIPAGEGLHDELALLVDAGVTPAEALRAAVTNPVRLLGLADSLGAIAPGMAADMILLETNPLVDIRSTRRIRMVIHRGRVLHPGRN